MIRITNLPVLLLIGLYDRQRYQDSSLWENVCDYADHTWGKITAAAGFDHIAGNRMDIETVFEAEREYGSYYDGWEDEEVFEEDDTPTGDDSTVLAEAGAMQDSPMAASPEATTFRHSVVAPPNSPRDRGHRVSTGIQAANATAAGAAAPLARVRRGSLSVYGPSPLAQLFVGGDATSHAAHRQRTVNVGSLPATSSFPTLSSSISPHRQQRLSFAGLARSTTRPSLSPMEDTIEERPTPTEPGMSRSLSPSAPLRARTEGSRQFPDAPPTQRMPSYGSFQESRRPQVTLQSPSPVISPKDTADVAGEKDKAEEVAAKDFATTEESAVDKQKQKAEGEPVPKPEAKGKEKEKEEKGPATKQDQDSEEKKETATAKAATSKPPPKETWPETLKPEDKKSPTPKESPVKAESSARAIAPYVKPQAATKGTPAESMRSTPESSQIVSVGGDVPAPPKLSLPKAKQGRKPSPSTGSKMTSPHTAPSGVPGGKAPTTASELLEKMENKQHDKKSTSDRTMEQLRAIEARQTRIEDMLMRLLDGAGAGGGGGPPGAGRGGRPSISRGSRSRGSRVEEDEEEESRPLQIRTPRHEEPHDTFDDYK